MVYTGSVDKALSAIKDRNKSPQRRNVALRAIAMARGQVSGDLNMAAQRARNADKKAALQSSADRATKKAMRSQSREHSQYRNMSTAQKVSSQKIFGATMKGKTGVRHRPAGSPRGGQFF